MSDKVVAKLAVGQIPDLDKTVPTAGDDEWDRLGRGEADARNPLSVAFRVTTDGVLALSKGIPETDSRVTGSYKAQQREQKKNQVRYLLRVI
jgi:hypothetical protein